MAQTGVGVDLGDGSVGVADPEEVPQQGQAVLEDRVEGPDRLGDLGPGGGRVVAVENAEQGPQELQHRQERCSCAWARACAVNTSSPGPAPFAELVARRLFPTPGPATIPTNWPSPRAPARAASSVAISCSRPTNREKPRAAATSSGVRRTRPIRSNTSMGVGAPFTVIGPRSRIW